MFNVQDSERAEGSMCRDIGSSKRASPQVIIQVTQSRVKHHENSPISQSNEKAQIQDSKQSKHAR